MSGTAEAQGGSGGGAPVTGRILESMTDGVLVLDLSGRIIIFNPAASTILGIGRQQALSRSFAELFLADEGCDEFTQTILDAVYVSAASHNRVVPYGAGGRRSLLSVTTSFLKSEGGDGTSGVIALFSDITDLLELQEKEVRLAGELQARERELELMAEIAARNRVLEHERALARKVQENILPGLIIMDGFETAAFYRPSGAIGGDFYSVLEKNGTLHFLIGDISGHSTSSALVMAVCNGMFRTLGQTMDDPREIVRAANRMLCPMLAESGMFVTLAYLVLDAATDRLTAVSAGHTPVYLCLGGAVEAIGSGGPVLGWDLDDEWEITDTVFPSGSTLFLHTDGLVETRDGAGGEFEERLIAILAECSLGPAGLVDLVVGQVTGFCQGRFEDDITICAVRRR